MWTEFYDLHSGGSTKEEPFECIYIEADSQKDAVRKFVHRFNHHPDSVACDCCGSNYSYSTYDTLDEASEHHRSYLKQTVEEYSLNENVLIIGKM